MVSFIFSLAVYFYYWAGLFTDSKRKARYWNAAKSTCESCLPLTPPSSLSSYQCLPSENHHARVDVGAVPLPLLSSRLFSAAVSLSKALNPYNCSGGTARWLTLCFPGPCGCACVRLGIVTENQSTSVLKWTIKYLFYFWRSLQVFCLSSPPICAFSLQGTICDCTRLITFKWLHGLLWYI